MKEREHESNKRETRDRLNAAIAETPNVFDKFNEKAKMKVKKLSQNVFLPEAISKPYEY